MQQCFLDPGVDHSAAVLDMSSIQGRERTDPAMARRDAPRRPPPIWARGWPHLTPMYLLRGYSRMLADAEDVARLVVCCTDRSRHDRMLDLTLVTHSLSPN
jgi:hypothetical protein